MPALDCDRSRVSAIGVREGGRFARRGEARSVKPAGWLPVPKFGLILVTATLLLAGCSGGPARDAPAVAVSQTHASVASLTLAVRLRLDDRSTAAYAQVMLETTRDAVADAQRELMVAGDADAGRWDVATPIVARAAAEVSALARSGASALTGTDLARLSALEADLARVDQDLGG